MDYSVAATIVGAVGIAGIMGYVATKKTKAKNTVGDTLKVIHNIQRRGFHAMELSSLEIANDPSKHHLIDGFIDFAEAINHFLHAHHSEEDNVMFPELREILGSRAPEETLTELTGDHGKMLPEFQKLDKLIQFLKENKGDKTAITDTLKELSATVAKIESMLYPHMREEESLLESELVASLPWKTHDTINKKAEEYGLSHVHHAELTVPIMWYLMNDKERSILDLPWVLRFILIPYVWKSHWIKSVHWFTNYNGRPVPEVFKKANKYDTIEL